jgi:hypothetical protein
VRTAAFVSSFKFQVSSKMGLRSRSILGLQELMPSGCHWRAEANSSSLVVLASPDWKLETGLTLRRYPCWLRLPVAGLP